MTASGVETNEGVRHAPVRCRESSSACQAGLFVVVLLAGMLVGPVPAVAAPLACGDTITEDTELDADLLGCTTEYGLVIGADNIVLDGNGAHLAGW